MNTLILALYGVNLLIFLLALLWILVPAFYGLPSRPTKRDRVRKALKLADLKQNETLYDLGAGDGRVLFIAANEFGAKAVGVEVAPVQCLLIWFRIVSSGSGGRVKIKMENFYRAELKDADVVYIYATLHELMKLAPHLEKTMKPGSRLVSISADIPEWEPSAIDDRNLIFAYNMPPKTGSLTTYMLKNSK